MTPGGILVNTQNNNAANQNQGLPIINFEKLGEGQNDISPLEMHQKRVPEGVFKNIGLMSNQ